MPDQPTHMPRLQASILGQQTNEYNSSLEGYDEKIDDLREPDRWRQCAGRTLSPARSASPSDIEGMREKLQELKVGSKLNTMLATDARLTMAGSLVACRIGCRTRRAASSLPRKPSAQAFIEHWNGQNSQDLAETRGKLVQAQQDYAKANLHNQLVVLDCAA